MIIKKKKNKQLKILLLIHSKYKIVAQKQFACDFMSTIRVHKMPIAFNTGKEEILVSPAYAVFEVVDEKDNPARILDDVV